MEAIEGILGIADEREGPGIEDGAVKRREKTAKMARLARRTEMRRGERRGTGLPRIMYCFGILKGSFAIVGEEQEKFERRGGRKSA